MFYHIKLFNVVSCVCIMGRIIIPKNSYTLKNDDALIFLAGPIGCARNWRNDAIRMLFAEDDNIVVASPQGDLSSDLVSHIINENGSSFSGARAWERMYLERASVIGTIMFWLPGRETHNYKECYGGMTRKELGDWTTEKKHRPEVRLVIGTDGNFPYGKTLEYDISQDLPDLSIHRTLEKTCAAALELAA